MDPDFTFEPTSFSGQGTWVKAGFHCHTTNSDGGLSPEETVGYFREKGYRCLGITDHGKVTPVASFSDRDFIGIDSTENGGDPDIVGVGVSSALPADSPLADRARGFAEQGGFTIAVHPTYCRVTPEEYLGCPELMAMEIYNAYCDEAYTNGVATELWDMVLGQGKKIWGVAGDDAHLNPRKGYYSDAGKAWVEIWTNDFTREGIINAMKCGAFYSTQGPGFTSLSVSDSHIQIECTPVKQVRWRTFGRVGYVHHAGEGNQLTTSRLPERFKADTFVRVELIDRDGKKAWSNPFFLTQSVKP